MDWKKIAPWSWFKEEEPAALAVQARAPIDASSDPIESLRNEMERWFDEAFRRLAGAELPRHTLSGRMALPRRPSIDISEGRKAYTIRGELPGVEREDISIEVQDRTLVVRAEKRRETEEEDEGYHCVERSYGEFQRVLTLPDDADAEAIEAKFRNGVLKLRIPKHAARASQGRTIELEAD